MKTKTHKIEIPETKIIATQLLNATPLQLLVITESKKIYLWQIEDNSYQYINDLSPKINTEKELSIYIHQQYVAIVENRGLHGQLLHLDNKKYRLILERGDYHPDNCS